jgi:hypothetical protein
MTDIKPTQAVAACGIKLVGMAAILVALNVKWTQSPAQKYMFL